MTLTQNSINRGPLIKLVNERQEFSLPASVSELGSRKITKPTTPKDSFAMSVASKADQAFNKNKFDIINLSSQEMDLRSQLIKRNKNNDYNTIKVYPSNFRDNYKNVNVDDLLSLTGGSALSTNRNYRNSSIEMN